MMYTRSKYHYLLKDLKKKKRSNIKQSVSKDLQRSDYKNYWKTVKSLRVNTYNSTPVVDGIHSGTDIANHFKNKYITIYNSVTSHSTLINSLGNRIELNVHTNCNADSNNCIHCHVITKFDVLKAVKKLKPDKDGLLSFENFINGSDLLFVYASLLFTVMLSHSFAAPDFVISGIIPIPTGARIALTESENYRSITISSLLSQIFDHIIIDNQVHSLSTSDYQFSFKSHSSTMVNETIQYYYSNGAKPVYILLLDASKAFDKVSFYTLFNTLLDNKMYPRTVKLLYYMYTNHSCYVTWSNNRSETFNISNGVKQSGVISPLLFSTYIDNLCLELRTSGICCHVGLTYTGAF